MPRYEEVLNSCKDTPGTVSPLDLPFATKFLAVHLFIKVKGSMTYQYFIAEMVNKAKTNGGFIDQKMFRTAGKYSLFLTDTSMQVLDGYINHIRPLLKPTCDYVLVTRNGGQQNKLGELMSKLVFDATFFFFNLYHINNTDTTRKKGKIKRQKEHITMGWYILKLNGVRGG